MNHRESLCQDRSSPEETIEFVLGLVGRDEAEMHEALDALPDPIYLTDCDGWVTFFNRACVDFTGRTPVRGEDRWCVTWKLYSEDGEFLPHDQCPMAVAVRERKRVRGVAAVAERPDGSRVNFLPFPTPLIGPDGEAVGAVNLLLDVTEERQADHLKAQAERCRRLASTVTDRQTVDTLRLMAEEYETRVRSLSRSNGS